MALGLARKLAGRSTHALFHHAAIVLKGGAILSTGYNFGYQHAEIQALQALWPSKRRGTRVWSLRFTKTGRLANAKPCQDCERFLRENGVKVVYYSDQYGDIVKMKLSK